MDFDALLHDALDGVRDWEASWGAFDVHPSLQVDPERLRAGLADYTDRLRGNYPFFHPRYAGQMLKPPHPAAIAAYVAAQRINPNNHALDGGPPTGQMEKEVVRDLAAMLRLPADTLGHLTSGGTIANLEALWVARQLHPGKQIAFSEDAHYTHGRMSGVLGADTVVIPADVHGRLDLDALEATLKQGQIGTLVVTAGTTALGVVDPIDDIGAMARAHGVRVHVDAAYGGFFALLAWTDGGPLGTETKRHLRAIGQCDSVAIDPHKHGLQPYGCGCVLFRDASVGRFYKHDSPYTYFTSDDLHLGEISLECSRAGAAAGALWLTLRLLPLRADEGLGPVLAASLRAARAWANLLREADGVRLFAEPEFDIVTFFPEAPSARAVDAASQDLFSRAMHDPDDPVFFSLLRVEAERLRAAMPTLEVDQSQARVLRSVLMKPEHEAYVPHLHARVLDLLRQPEVSR